MKKYISIIMALLLILSFAACGNENNGSKSSSVSDYSDSRFDIPQKLTPVTKNKFLNELSDLGEVNDSSDQDGFEACFIKAENVNYIYMNLPSADMAERLLCESKDEESSDNNYKVICSGENYEYSETRSISLKDNLSQYNLNLRAENTLIVFSGSNDDREEIIKYASSALKKLGYDLPKF